MILRLLCLLAAAMLARAEVPQATKDAIDAKLTLLENSMYTVGRQMLLQRLGMEESTRSDGDSGVKQVRVTRDGNRAWLTPSHVSQSSTAAIHDHSELKATCGMGEMEVVLNGVHFRTRHNDYGVVMPSKNSSDYHATQPVPFPPVPPEILAQPDMTVAFRDMRSYFRAWLNGDDSEFDYKPYFRPVLCYLEGAWTTDADLDEPFDSERHHLDALSWFDLQEKARFTAYTGDKDQLENYAYLPTAIVNISGIEPVLSQWNYRIACHPIEGDELQVRHLSPVDDLQARVGGNQKLEDLLKTRKARFTVKEYDTDRMHSAGLMDRLMAQIPGKDNYMANIVDSNLNTTKYDIQDDNKVLNAGFYHRYVSHKLKDAMGVSVNKRGFADRQLYVAHTTQSRIAPSELNHCDRSKPPNCYLNRARVSYAIPLEIIWLSPLNAWNPYGFADRGEHWTEEGQAVTAGGRVGGLTPDTAFNGTNSRNHFLTPVELFRGGEIEVDPADTVPGSVGVLGPSGSVHRVTASGVRIFLPDMLDVGNVRTRYPIFPVHAEGNTAAKELEALSKVVMDLNENLQYLRVTPQFKSNETDDVVKPDPTLYWYRMQTAPSGRGTHFHYVDMRTKHAIFAMDGCETYQVRTSQSKKHTHLMTIRFNQTANQWEYLDCDGRATCWDKHGITLTPLTQQ